MSRSHKYHSFHSCYCGNRPGQGKSCKRIAAHRDRMLIRTALSGNFDPDEYHLPHRLDCFDPYDSHKDGMGYSSYYDAVYDERVERYYQAERQGWFTRRGYYEKWGRFGISQWKKNMVK